MTALWWALGAAVLIFAARALSTRSSAAIAGARPRAPNRPPKRPPRCPAPLVSMISTKPLTGIPAIRNFFRSNTTPVYFVSATAFNLLGIDRWVRNLRFVNYYDSFDGTHPNVFVPKEQTPRAFASIEEI